ncbi:MAG: TIGR01777 family oxidoreductase [Candidatus Zixiibacteriota bacterium]
MTNSANDDRNLSSGTVAVSGAGGLIGSAVVKQLAESGMTVRRLVRSVENPAEDEIPWSVADGILDAAKMSDVDHVVHLAGETILGFWSENKKRRIRDSRVNGARALSESLALQTTRASQNSPLRTLICASAIGYYGDRGGEILTEESAAGDGFLADVSRAWERATDPAREAGIRVVNLRIGVTLAKHGGTLKKMAPPFRLGLGGRLGDGKQYMSWVALKDVTRAISFLLKNESLSGPVNMTAPNPVTNGEFTSILGRILRRPTLITVPAFALRLLLREQANELFLTSQRVIPQKLMVAGFSFRHAEPEDALRSLLS